MLSRLGGWLLVVVLLGHTLATPLPFHESESRPLAVVSDLGQRLASHSLLQDGSPRLQAGDSGGVAERLGLPSPQELEAIKKVAQILVMLGEQVIPTIIGDIAPPPPPSAHCISCASTTSVEDVPNDPMNDN